MVPCGECWAEPGEPCGDARGALVGLHLGRFARARRRGLLAEAEVGRVLELAGDVPTAATVHRQVLALRSEQARERKRRERRELR